MTVCAPEWICVHYSSLIKSILKLNSPLCCIQTKAACCSIAPPGGHTLLCCHISISLPISFQSKRPVLFPFHSCDPVADSLSHFPHNLTVYLSLSAALSLLFLPYNFIYDDGPFPLTQSVSLSVRHSFFFLKACLPHLTTLVCISLPLWSCLCRPPFSDCFFPLSLPLLD